MSTIHVGVFTSNRDATRLPAEVRTDGDSFLRWGEPARPGDPIHLQVDGGAVSLDRDGIRQGYETLDDLLEDGERLTDYALVTEGGEVVEVITILDAEVYDVAEEPDHDFESDRAVEPPSRNRRWSPFR